MKMKWQFAVREWIDNKAGLYLLGARPKGRGPWLTDAMPARIKEYLSAAASGKHWIMPDFHSIAELVANAANVTFQKRRGQEIRGWFEVEREKVVLPPRIDVDLKKLRDILRDMNEGRNLTTYSWSWRGSFQCPKDERGKYCVWEREDWSPKGRKYREKHIKEPYLKGVRVRWAKCPACKGRHTVIWEYAERKGNGCFDVISFGWKDADLDAEGCTGISELVAVEGKRIVVEASGHKTLCDPTYEFEFDLTEEDKDSYSEVAHSIVCDCACSGEWTGDDWSLSFNEHVKVPVVHKNNVVDYKATAERIRKAALKCIHPYEKTWSECSHDLNELYKELYAKYEKKEKKDGEETEGA